MNPELSHVGMTLCFWCGEPDCILLDTRLRKVLPREACYNYNPCLKCKEKMALGVLLIEVTEKPGVNTVALNGKYPTGRWAVVKSEAAKSIFAGTKFDGCKKLMIDPEAAEKLGLFREKLQPA